MNDEQKQALIDERFTNGINKPGYCQYWIRKDRGCSKGCICLDVGLMEYYNRSTHDYNYGYAQ